jgi:hypothetical protein
VLSGVGVLVDGREYELSDAHASALCRVCGTDGRPALVPVSAQAEQVEPLAVDMMGPVKLGPPKPRRKR